MPGSSSLRRRKKGKNKEQNADPPAADASNTTTIVVGLEEQESLFQTFSRHPLVRVTPFVLLPYIIYHAIYFFSLRRPDLVTQATLGLVQMRPAVAANEPRQVLILGAEITENRFVSGGMASLLKLEIVHEAFDAENYFCRDGSVSLFQFMRFLEPLQAASLNKEARYAAWKELCMDRNSSMVDLFHPKEYISSECSPPDQWSNCWAQECFSMVKSIWACEQAVDRDCPQTFTRILHQVRHPMKTIESLNATVCSHANVEASFQNIIAGFFPNRDWTSLPCLNAMAWYTIDFHSALIKAREEGLVHGVFQIEQSSPCEVASLAGFLEESSAVYPLNSKKIADACYDDEDTKSDAKSRDTFTRVKMENDGATSLLSKSLAIDDFADTEIVDAIKRLVTRLGYDKDGNSEFL